MIRVLSLGAGVQSTTVAGMIASGELPPVDCAIFADTQWEPAAVYEHLKKLKQALPFPVYIVTAGNIREAAISGINTTGQKFSAIPWYSISPHGKRGMGRRQCTSEYKLNPIKRKVVELLGGRRPKGGCEMLIGISTDEASRMKPSRVQYIVNKYPLIELGMSRRDCKTWLADKGWTAPRSACIACPYRSDAEFKLLTPAEFADACEADVAIRHLPGVRGEQYVHRSLKPLSEVDLSTAEERGQLNMFNNECEGMCGL